MRVRLMLIPWLMAATVAADTVTRTIHATLPFTTGAPVAVENLAGTMTVTAAEVDAVEVTAVVHAESARLAEAVALRHVTGKGGVPTLRVIYPLTWASPIYYPDGSAGGVEYDGRRVRVSHERGREVWAEVTVRVPRQGVHGSFRNAVGTLDASGVAGTVLLDTASGDITARDLSGTVKADTGAGDVEARGLRGTFTCDTGSGTCLVVDFDGDTVSCDTGAGEVEMRRVRATRASADTGSGTVRVEDADVEEFRADTGSGDVVLAGVGARLRRATVDTGSGSVRLRLPADLAFELRTDVGSGDVVCRFTDATPMVDRRKVVGYRRGHGGVTIDVDTGSGDVVVEPLPQRERPLPERPPQG